MRVARHATQEWAASKGFGLGGLKLSRLGGKNTMDTVDVTSRSMQSMLTSAPIGCHARTGPSPLPQKNQAPGKTAPGSPTPHLSRRRSRP